MEADSHSEVACGEMVDSNASTLAAALRGEAAYLRENLTPDRVFRMHAQHLLYRRAKLKIDLKVKISLTINFLSNGLIMGVVCAYPWAPRGWRSSLLRVGIVGSGVMLCALWNSFRLQRSLLDPRFALPETPPSETLEISQKLGWFLDHASSTPPPGQMPQPPLVLYSTALEWLEAIYKDEPEGALYSSLPIGRRTVRLLVVEPGDFDAEIKCTLYQSDIIYPYEALSYVWGDESSGAETITVDGQPFTIRHNLSRALRYLRRKDQQRLIWVDAICINQNDPQERNHQVAMMSDIYEHAEAVLVFLASEGEIRVSELYDFFEALKAIDDVDSVLERTDIPTVLDQFWPLLERPWWSRVWVVQEFAYARRDPLLVCGHRHIDARTFWRGLDLLRERMMADLYPRRGLLRYLRPGGSLRNLFDSMDDSPVERWHMIQMRHSLLSWRTMFHPVMYNMSDILKITRMHKATDHRDHVFAMHSLMMEPFRTAFAPDYSQTTATTYTRMASYLLCIQPWPEVYNFFAIGSSNLGLPSWVPDFSRGLGHNAHDRFWTLPFPMESIGQMQCSVTAGVLVSQGIDFGEATQVMDLEYDGENIVVKPRGEPSRAPALDEIKKLIVYVKHSMARTDRKEGGDDPGETLYRLFAAHRFDPNQPPFITQEDVAELLGQLTPSTKLAVTKVLMRYSIRRRWSADGWDNQFLNQTGELLKLIRRNKHNGLRQLEESRTTRMEQKAERSRLELEQIQEDLGIDHAEQLKSVEQVTHAADEFERRVHALREEEDGDAWLAAALPHTIVETDTGIVGIASGAVREGDRLVLLQGVASLFIARPIGDGGEYSFVGRVMVHQGTVETMTNWIEEGLLEREMSFR